MLAPPPALRLAEPLAALSLASDLARGHTQDEALRATVVAMHVADAMGLPPSRLEAVYYGTLLRYVGCTATSPQYVATYDASDVTVRQRGDYLDVASTRDAMRFLVSLGDDLSGRHRLAHFLAALRRARAALPEAARADCEVGAALVRQFGLGAAVQEAVLHSFERWDGKGAPNRVRGTAVPLETRIASAAYVAVMFAELDAQLARDTIAARAGTALDPDVAGALLARFECVPAALHDDAWVAALAAEPQPVRRVHDDQLTPIARGYAHVADLKSTYLHGHSDGVAELACAAAGAAGLSDADTVGLTRAAYLHDIGRVGIDTRIWDKPGALTTAEWEQVRLHPIHTERILRRTPCLEPLCAAAASHHERSDGSGYPHARRLPELSLGAQLLIAADVFHALIEERPHRRPHSIAEAASVVRSLGLDARAAGAVLEAQGQPAPQKREHPAGLSEREVDVLRLLARGSTKHEVAHALHVSPSTVHTHTVHIYDKVGVRSRAALALFAMEQGLLRS